MKTARKSKSDPPKVDLQDAQFRADGNKVKHLDGDYIYCVCEDEHIALRVAKSLNMCRGRDVSQLEADRMRLTYIF